MLLLVHTRLQACYVGTAHLMSITARIWPVKCFGSAASRLLQTPRPGGGYFPASFVLLLSLSALVLIPYSLFPLSRVYGPVLLYILLVHCIATASDPESPVRRGACLVHPAKQISVSVLCQGSSAGWEFDSVRLRVADALHLSRLPYKSTCLA